MELTKNKTNKIIEINRGENESNNTSLPCVFSPTWNKTKEKEIGKIMQRGERE